MKAHPILTADTRVTWDGYLGVVVETPRPGEEVLVRFEGDRTVRRIKASELLPLRDIKATSPETPIYCVPDAFWDNASKKNNACQKIEASSAITGAVSRAAFELGFCEKTIWRALVKYRKDPRASAQIEHKRGRKTGSRYLEPRVEAIVDDCLKLFYLTENKPKLSLAIEAVETQCTSIGLPVPSASTVRRRARMLKPQYVTRQRQGARAFREKYTPVPGSLVTSNLQQVIEIDHTLSDIIVVSDDDLREPIGRPWLTLAICTTSRMVVGMYVTMEPPSSMSLAMCILSIITPKQQLFSRMGLTLEASWPSSDYFDEILTDNARELHGKAMLRGCEQYGMSLRLRPVGLPHWGGAIERLIGTTMGRLPLLPGATQRDVRARGRRDVERHACMTLGEFRQWLVTDISTQYHQRVHRALGMTPLAKWKELAPVIPRDEHWSEADILKCLVQFLPYEMRKVTRTGIEFECLRYWCDGLAEFVADGMEHAVMYDPRDIRRVYLIKSNSDVVVVDCVYDLPAMSLAEWRHRKSEDRENGRASVDWQIRIKGFEENQTFLNQCKRKQKVARRDQSKREERHRDAAAVSALANRSREIPSDNPLEENFELTPYPVEEVDL